MSISDSEVKIRPYGYSDVFLLVSGKSTFDHRPDWYYQLEYPVEKNRGYDYHEDLFSIGQFTVTLKKGGSTVLYAGMKNISYKKLKEHYRYAKHKSSALNNMDECMDHAANQFIIKKKGTKHIKAGYPWFGCWGRDTYISLPGLTLVSGHIKTFKEIISAQIPNMKNGVLPNISSGRWAAYNAADTSLWFIWAIHQYAIHTGQIATVWEEYGAAMHSVLDNYKKGALFHIKMDEDGLIGCGTEALPLTWMDCIIDGKAVTPRNGKAVEINALWFNAVCFCLEVASKSGDQTFVKQWKDMPEKIRGSFVKHFIKKGIAHLADYTNDDYTDWRIRPNQVIALSLPYSVVPDDIRKSALEVIRRELLTSRGLRTLAPTDPAYHGSYHGDQVLRDRAYHQGTVWPWLLGHFADAWLKEYGADGVPLLEDIYKGFEPALQELCLYTLPELYDGDYPHRPGGAIAQAWSVAELMRMHHLIEEHKVKHQHSEISNPVLQ